MKREMTRKEASKHYKVWKVGYADLQRLLGYEEANFYNHGIYGWNWDGYRVPEMGILITTGYRNQPKGEYIPYEVCRAYEELADEVRNQYKGYTETKQALRNLLLDLLQSLEG